MNFLTWHYTYGLDFYLRRLSFLIRSTIHYYSLPLLVTTLFSPWKRLVDVEKHSSFDITKWLERTSFNAVSRVMGAIARIVLFASGVVSLVFISILGSFGFILWLLIPFLSWGVYQRYKTFPKHKNVEILQRIKGDKLNTINIILSGQVGKFMVQHLGVSSETLSQNADLSQYKTPKNYPETYKEIIENLVDQKVWSDNALRKIGLKKEDILNTAAWWDRKCSSISDPDIDPNLGRPGFGYELLFGFTPTLTKLSVDLSAPQPFTHHLIGRKNIVERMERTLNSDSNVFLVGEPGIGKKTITLEFARRAAEGELGANMAYRRILEFDQNFLLSESVDVNQKKVALATALAEAEGAGNVILVIRDLHRLTNAMLEGFDFTDVFEEYLEKRKLKIIALTTADEYEKYLSKNMRLRKHFEIIRAEQPSRDEAIEIVMEAASIWEARRSVVTLTPAIRMIVEDSDRYVTDTPFPEKAIELLDAVVFYKEQNDRKTAITIDDVNIVLSERTGVPFARITESEKEKLGNLEEIIHKQLVNQNQAVSLIGKILRSKAIGVVRSNRPIGSFLFLGPTGVGKTETAKVLANVYFGSTANILRFDMAEYAGRDGVERLIGSTITNLPGALATSIQNKPASLLLLDEIEKAPREVFNLFLALLDEGKFTDAFGRSINGQNLFIIATTNAGAPYIKELVEKNTNKEDLQKSVIDYVIKENIFSPEFINRFDGAVVYEPLTEEHLVQVAAIMFKDLANALKEKGISLKTKEPVWRKLAHDGYDPSFGARPMRRVLELSVGDLVGRGIISGDVKDGDTIEILPGEAKDEYVLQKL